MHTNISSFSEQILLDFDTRDVGLYKNMVQPIKLGLFKKVFFSKSLA